MAPKKEQIAIKYPEIKGQPIEFRVRGTAPLICNKPTAAAIEDLSGSATGGQRAKKGARNPHQEFLDKCWVLPGSPPAGEEWCKYGLPSMGFKKLMARAAKGIPGLNMTDAKDGRFRMLHSDTGGLVPLEFDELRMRSDTIITSDKKLQLAYRPEFVGWRCVLRIWHIVNEITPDQLAYILALGGVKIGWGTMRAELGYGYGTFELE